MRGSSKHMNPEQENAQKTDEEIDQMTVQEASVVIKAARLSVPEWRLSSGQERRGSDHLQQVREQAKIARDALLTKVHYQEAKPTVQALKARQDATNEVKAVQVTGCCHSHHLPHLLHHHQHHLAYYQNNSLHLLLWTWNVEGLSGETALPDPVVEHLLHHHHLPLHRLRGE